MREPLLPEGRRPPAPGALLPPAASPRLLGDCATASARFMGLRLACIEGVSSGVAEPPMLVPRPLPGMVVHRTRYVCRRAMYSWRAAGRGRGMQMGLRRTATAWQHRQTNKQTTHRLTGESSHSIRGPGK